jgi:hypothetical protein
MKHVIRHIRHETWERHMFDYLLLAVAALFFVLAFRLFSGERTIQFFLLLSFTLFYVSWGMYHHILTKTMRLKVLLEYVLVGFAVLFLALTLAFP